MAMYSYSWVANLMMGWLVAVSVAFIGYLLVLQVKEMRRKREMDEQREKLGLRRVCGSLSSWLF
jgi:hypothetical protein